MKLKCEKCGYEPPARDCPACGEPVPKWAGFCHYCGEFLPQEEEDAPPPGDRRLCPDGNCIGILDESGHCVICGLSG